jgi:CDP-diacylglycerol--glycerol-3-phosphate 3-phosphatidyltransferase
VPLNAPNVLTLLRIILIPVFVIVYYGNWEAANVVATGVFVLAGVTDWLDGFLARKLDQHSAFGAFLDPVADKLMVSTALVLLATDTRVLPMVWDVRAYAVMVAVIIGREIAVSALREWMAELGARAKVSVSYVGKFKTSAQMLAVGFMVFREPLAGLPIFRIGELLLLVAALLTLWSMVMYMRAAWPKLMDPDGG